MPLQQFDERTQFVGQLVFGNADTPSTWTYIVNQGSQGDLRLDVVSAFNSDTVDHILAFSYNNDTNGFLGEVTVAAGAGFGAVPRVDVIAALRPAANPYIQVPYALPLNVTFREAISSGKHLFVTADGGVF